MVGLAFHLLPSLGPEPRLVGRYGDVWTENYLAVTFENFHLRAGTVQPELAPERLGDGDHASGLDGDEARLFLHDDSIAVAQ